MTLWRYFTEKEIKIRLSMIVINFCFVILQLIFLGSLFSEGVSRSPAKSVMELLPTLVSKFQLITNVARTSALDVSGALDAPLLLKSLFFRVFLKVLVSEFGLIIGLRWQCIFSTAYTLLLMKIYTCLL